MDRDGGVLIQYCESELEGQDGVVKTYWRTPLRRLPLFQNATESEVGCLTVSNRFESEHTYIKQVCLE